MPALYTGQMSLLKRCFLIVLNIIEFVAPGNPDSPSVIFVYAIVHLKIPALFSKISITYLAIIQRDRRCFIFSGGLRKINMIPNPA